ncbi:Metalloproteases (zincins), catalytic [Glarea lozoyensis ATCC 20868]|uniref:Metalloproteases (Zincins), catalytic n=1 Tax=Glarea lozoyensis (strain ATCC 20868 / MF5171) TaxID=1116229 RepID=S3D7W8_GLAL2|nr:Metalloproteases (zincins), catalytic [Glarea lozoyensis ATCC 20868]EPE33830.1 Metalloproteases (zincins), catalytic [Glarea lozoyensis ATCC 20868]
MFEKTLRLPAANFHSGSNSKLNSLGRRCIFHIAFSIGIVFLIFNKYHGGNMQQNSVFTEGILDQISNFDTTTGKEEDRKLCVTPECVHAASEILYNLNPDQTEWDFCGDFEGTVCQGFREHHELRVDQSEAFAATLMKDRSQSLMRHVLDGEYPDIELESKDPFSKLVESTREADRDNFSKLKNAYNACLDTSAVEKVGLEPLILVLTELEQKPLSDALSYLAELGAFPLVAAGVGPDFRDSGDMVVFVWPANTVGLPAKEFYLDDRIFNKYIDVVEKTFCNPVVRRVPQSSCRSIAQDIVRFERSLAAVLPEREDYGNLTRTYNPMTLVEADELAPLLQLPNFLQALSDPEVQIDRIILEIPESMKEINGVLSNTTDPTVRAYLRWKAIQHFASTIESDALYSWKQLLNELLGKEPTSIPERWRTCLQNVEDGLGWMLSKLFVSKSFSSESKQFAEDIVSDIQEQWIAKLKTIDWMDDKVKARAIQKTRNIVAKVGYPVKSPDITDPLDLQHYYQSVNISTLSHFDNVVSMNHFRVRSEWSALGKPVDMNAWMRPAITVNAWYDPTGNEVNFPAGLLQLPIFSPTLPQYLSYGAFGSLVGHELSHAFDGIGRHIDESGNYTEWWTPEAVEAFNSRATCFTSQYSHFAVPGTEPNSHLNVSGLRTLNENIADAGGINAAFEAWKSRASTEPKEANMDLPGLKSFSHEQLFFVGFANWFCSKSTKQTAVRRIYTDSHAPMWVRALGTTRNSRAFREAFDCKVKEPTCELW